MNNNNIPNQVVQFQEITNNQWSIWNLIFQNQLKPDDAQDVMTEQQSMQLCL